MQTSLTLAMLVLFGPCAVGGFPHREDGDEPVDLRTRKDGSDWPRFLGPTCNGVSPEKGILTNWPKAGLKVVWQASLGDGFAPPVVSKGRLFHFDRFENNARLTCRNAETGKELWRFEYPTTYVDMYGYSPGPRPCPVVDGSRVYIYGVEGMLHCLDVTTGKQIWKKDIKAEYHFHQNFFGVGSVPFVEGDLLIVAVGGSPKGVVENLSEAIRNAQGNGCAIVAFDKKTGVEKYRTSDELASYSSPIVAKVGDRRLGLYFARGGLMAFDPATGKVDFEYKYRARTFESVNAATPVVVGDKVLISECYEKGSVLLKVEPGKATEIWNDADRDRRGKAAALSLEHAYICGRLYIWLQRPARERSGVALRGLYDG